MPFVTAPNLIEQSDFTQGWSPDGSNVHQGPGALNDVTNLLLEESTGALVTRKGMSRPLEELTGDSNRYIISLHHFETTAETRYIIAVTTTGASAANNVKIYAINVGNWTATRIDTAGRTWTNMGKPHWGIAVDGVFYGGVQGEPMYSWDGTTWDADASGYSNNTIVDDTDAGVDSTEYARDYAYRGHEKGTYNGSTYTPNEGIRYDRWETGENYQPGDRVSLKGTWDTGVTYWKSFRCIKAHTANATNKPQLGTGSPGLYWKKVMLSLPEDEDGNVNVNDWSLVLAPPETSIGVWFANRMWLRDDSYGDKSRLMFSAPVKLEKGEDVADTVFDARDFTPGSDLRGDGGGWWPFNDGKHDGAIKAVAVYGAYLVVFKSATVWVLTGQSSQTFTARKLYQGAGCKSPTGFTQHRGLLYFLGDDGLYVTDGTVVEPVVGLEKVRDWFRTRLDSVQADSATYRPTVWNYGDFVWASLPLPSDGTPYVTVAYHPETGSFWKTDLPVLETTKVGKDGTQHIYFSTPASYGLDILYKYGGTTDDTGAATAATANIDWSLTTAWWPFGLAREQRRVRRTWALVKGAMTYSLKVYRNYVNNSGSIDTSRVISGTHAQYVEGSWVPDAHAVLVELSSDRAAATVHGIAVQTEPRRIRYHS